MIINESNSNLNSQKGEHNKIVNAYDGDHEHILGNKGYFEANKEEKSIMTVEDLCGQV